MRKLGTPVDEILKLFQGNISMAECLEHRKAALEKEEKNVERMHMLAEQMLEQNPSIQDIDIDFWLDEMEKMENVTYMQAGPVLIIGLPEEVDDHVCNGIREETDRYISAGKVQKLIFDFSKTGFMDSSGIGILLGRYKRMHHMGGEVLVTGEDAKIRRLLRISGVYQVVGTL